MTVIRTPLTVIDDDPFPVTSSAAADPTSHSPTSAGVAGGAGGVSESKASSASTAVRRAVRRGGSLLLKAYANTAYDQPQLS